MTIAFSSGRRAFVAACGLTPCVPLWAQHVHPAAGAKRRAPALAISAAISPTGELWVVGLNEQARLFVQRSGDEGRSWQPPREIATGADPIAADGENRPKLAFGPEGAVVITYTQPLDKPYTGRIRMLRSSDGGASFSAPFTVHADRQVITHRFESVAFDAHGTLHTLWIDKRDLQAQQTARHAGADNAKASYRGAAIYRNESNDGGKTFGPDIKLADHSCECCRIALAAAPGGGLAVLWRHVFALSERDHAFALIGNDAPRAAPVRATFDHWSIDACPHHGPGLAPAAGGGYHAVWFGDKDGAARVRYARLGPAGSPQTEPVVLPDERAEHADVRSAGDNVAIVWRSFDGQATRWRAWLSTDNGRHFALRELGRSSDDNDHPQLAAHGQRIFALWRTTQGVRVERLFP